MNLFSVFAFEVKVDFMGSPDNIRLFASVSPLIRIFLSQMFCNQPVFLLLQIV